MAEFTASKQSPAMAEFIASKQSPIISLPTQSAAPFSSSGLADGLSDDACSICLEPFTTQDPAAVTRCKHEFHLQCILEWSQRSKECPNCWQALALKDPTSQELLAATAAATATATERSLRPGHLAANSSTSSPRYYEYDSEYETYPDGSDFDEHIMQHLAAAISRAHYVQERERQRSCEAGPSHGFMFSPHACASNMQQIHPNSPEDCYSAYESSGGSSPTSSISSVMDEQPPSLPIPSVGRFSTIGLQRDGYNRSRTISSQSPPGGTQMPRLSEPPAFSESIKSRWSAASARYKDSVTRRTQGLREKFIMRNKAVKELSKGIQREMNATISGLAKLVERLDLKSKRNMSGGQGFCPASGTSDVFTVGNGVQESVVTKTPGKHRVEVAQHSELDGLFHVTCSAGSPQEFSHAQRVRNMP
ncbi:hypothetical protein Ancab_030420 [Ancistrocladus abbreviatus]